MKDDRSGRGVLSFVSVGFICLLAVSAGRAEAFESPEELIRGNVRMKRRAAVPAETREAQPAAAHPDERGRPLSEERIVSGNGSRWLADELILGYRQGTTRRQKDQLRAERGFRRIASKRDKLSKLEVELVELPARLDSSGLEALMADLRAEPSVEYVEPNFVIENGGSGPETAADLAEAVIDAVDHGEDAFGFPGDGSEHARTVQDALIYARRNSGRVSGGRPASPDLKEKPALDREPTTSEPDVLPPPVRVYSSSQCNELTPFLREDAAVQARINLPVRLSLKELKAVEKTGARITHLVYRWNDHAALYPLSAGEDLDVAAKKLKAMRERYAAEQVESLGELVAEFKPLDEEQERFRQALESHRDAYRRESQDLAAGLFRVDAADVLLPVAALRSIGRQESLKLESCTVRGDSLLGTPSNGEVAAQASSEDDLPAPSTWMPSMGVHRVDLRATASPKTLKSYFWWNDATGFEHPHLAYEHDIRILPWDFLECEETWWAKVPETKFVKAAQWRDFIFGVNDRVWEGWECSQQSVLVHTTLPAAYTDIRLYDRKGSGKMFGVGTSTASLIDEHELYEISFDLILKDPTVTTATLVFQPQLAHWHSDYDGDETPPIEKSHFCSLSGQFCTSESCLGEETDSQACVFTSDFLTVSHENFKNGELSIIPWSTNIGLYGGESNGKWLACRSNDTAPCRKVVQNINDESTERIRDLYKSHMRFRDGGPSTGTYHCNKLGVPYDDGGGIYVHFWDGVRLQNFKHPAGTECERFGNDGETAIIYNPDLDKAFLLRDGMWEKYRSTQGPLQLGAPTSNEYPLQGLGAQQNFERGCLIYYLSTNTVQQKAGAACANPPTLPDFRYGELGGLRVKSASNQLEMFLRAQEAGSAAAPAMAASGGDFIDLDLVRPELKKIFLQALTIPNHKHRISLNIVGTGGFADVPAPFERTEMADAFLHADVAMKFDLFGESGLSQETGIWTNLVRQSPFWSELQSKGFEEYPYWVIAATIIRGEVTATRTGDRIVVEDVELDLNAGWWWQEPTLDLSGYSLSTAARNDLMQRLATYKTTLQNIVKNYARDVVVPEMNRTENLDPRYKRLKSMYSAIVLAQWYKERARQNPKLPLANRIDTENLTGIDKGTPFNQAFWNGQANQLLWSGPCTAFWGTAECEIFGGLALSDSEPEILRDLTPDQEQMVAVVLDDFGTVEVGDTHYLYGEVLTASTAELSLGEIGFQTGPHLAGRPVTLQVRVLNTGITASGSFFVTVHDDVPGGQRYSVGQATVSLASMAAATVSFPWTLPLKPGMHSFTIAVDSTQAVGEANEIDNTGVRTLDVGSTSPTAEIQFPVDASVFTAGDLPFLVGVGIDPEEGELTDGELVWSSSLDGALGIGQELENVALSVGEHSITLTVTDGEGLSASDQIRIRIEPPALDYYTVIPCRVLDTRSGAALSPGSAREFPVGNLCGVPPSAWAVSVNVTAILPSGAGYVTLWPAGIPRPNTSAISFSAGRTRASNMILPLAGDGSGLAAAEAIFSGSGSVHMAIDVTGYFE